MTQMMIKSLLDQDLYKFSMQQGILHQFPNTDVKFEFFCRSGRSFGANLVKLIPQIKQEIKNLCTLSFTEEELQFLKDKLYYLKPDYINFLSIFRLEEKFVNVYEKYDQLHIEIHGPWLHVSFFEVFILAIISELYNEQQTKNVAETALLLNTSLNNTINLSRENVDFKFMDFGTRRRYSQYWQEQVVETLAQQIPNNFLGTSNVYLAKKYNLKCFGTHAHEWFMGCQVLTRLKDFQRFALQKWADEYRGDLGIALSDTVGIDSFLKDFDKYFAKLFDGIRQDSGDPFEVGEKIISHYEKLGIDPRTKRIVFSDSLDVPLAISLCNIFKNRIGVSFGIGTKLTNDTPNALSMVMKMTECNGQPVAKISDSNGKCMCQDDSYIKYLRSVFI